MKKKTLIVCITAFVLLCCIALGIYFETRPKPTVKLQMKMVTVEVYYEGEIIRKVTSQTSRDYLADFLVDKGFVSEKEKAFFSTVCEIEADWNKDNAWWKITKNGEECNYGAAELALSDGDKYEITYTIGFDW